MKNKDVLKEYICKIVLICFNSIYQLLNFIMQVYNLSGKHDVANIEQPFLLSLCYSQDVFICFDVFFQSQASWLYFQRLKPHLDVALCPAVPAVVGGAGPPGSECQASNGLMESSRTR